MDYHIAGMVHVSGGANGGFQLVQRKLVGDDGFQNIPDDIDEELPFN